MEPKDHDAALDAYIQSAAVLLGITIAPEWMPQVRASLLATNGATRLFEAFPLPDEAEPAPVFEA